MEYTRTYAGRGYDIYRVTGDFLGLTYQEIADKIDCNNWGYDVRWVTPEFMEIKIYTD